MSSTNTSLIIPLPDLEFHSGMGGDVGLPSDTEVVNDGKHGWVGNDVVTARGDFGVVGQASRLPSVMSPKYVLY